MISQVPTPVNHQCSSDEKRPDLGRICDTTLMNSVVRELLVLGGQRELNELPQALPLVASKRTRLASLTSPASQLFEPVYYARPHPKAEFVPVTLVTPLRQRKSVLAR